MTEDALARLAWVGRVNCEGGPVLVTEPASFADWFGAESFLELQKRFPGDTRFVGQRRTVHYWGQFSDKLPAPFTLEEGGHAFIECGTEAEARAKLEELRATVAALMPGVLIRDDVETGNLHLSTWRCQQMSAELSPDSQYSAAWQTHEGEDAWVQEVGRGQGLFYHIEGGGIADVGVSAARDEVVLVRSWVDDDDDTAQVHAHVDAPRSSEVVVGEITFTGEHLVAVWSTLANTDIDEGIASADQCEAVLGDRDALVLSMDAWQSPGTLVRIQPGRYQIAIAHTDDEDDENPDEDRPWSARWCRLTRMGEVSAQ